MASSGDHNQAGHNNHSSSRTPAAEAETICCESCCASIRTSLHPCMTHHNPLPDNPSRAQRVKHAFLCPPHGKVGKWLTRAALLIVTWALLWSLTGDSALPPTGWIFALLVLYAACTLAGYFTTFLKLPPLLGMLVMGAVLRNVPHIDIASGIPRDWSSNIRTVALVVILIKAGLGLKADELRKLSLVVPRLSLAPGLVEGTVVGVISHFFLKFPWPWSFVLGFIMAALSPAVVVNYMLPLADQGYGVRKGIPTLIIGSMTIDNVVAIALFGITLGVATAGGFTAYSVVKGPIEVIGGVAYGVVLGVFLWYFPKQKSKNLVLYRFWLLFAGCLFATFGSSGHLAMRSAGPIASLCAAFIAAIGWKRQGWPHQNPIFKTFCKLWTFLEPLLFGLVGAGVDVQIMMEKPESVGWGILILFIGLTVRMLTAMAVVFKQGLTWKEKVFIAVAWVPKATVQAAIGSIPLDVAKKMGDAEDIAIATEIATISAIAILLVAPLGAGLIMFLGPRLLEKADPEEDVIVLGERDPLTLENGEVGDGSRNSVSAGAGSGGGGMGRWPIRTSHSSASMASKESTKC